MATSKKDSRLTKAGVSGYNKPKRTPSHPTKSHVVVAKSGGQIKTIRFGQQGVKTNQTAGQRKAFKSRHAKNIARGPMSAAYWANKVKWSPSKTKSSSSKWKKGWFMAAKKKGLYANIHAKRKRIKAGSGEKMRKPGTKGAPTAKAFKQSAKTAKKK